MTRRGLYWLGATLAICAAALTLAILLGTDSRPSDYKRLQGAWMSEDNRVTLTVNHDLAVLEGLPEPRPMFFRLQPRAVPKRIILCPADLPTRPEWYILGMKLGPPVAQNPQMEAHAIYDLEGDRLRICFPLNPSDDFPKSFDPSVGMIQEYHRP